MSYEHNHDRIVYVLYDDEKAMVGAHYDKAAAKEQADNCRYSLVVKPEVHDVSAMRQQILDRMSPLERLIMDPPKPDTKRRG